MEQTTLGVLRNDDCRRTLDRLLDERAGPAHVSDLAGTLSAEPADVTQARIRLYHYVLPKLEAADVIEYDWDAGEVRLTASAEDRSVLAAVFQREPESPLSPIDGS